MPKFRAFVEPGKYEVRVVGATKGISRQGNEMITLRRWKETAVERLSRKLRESVRADSKPDSKERTI